jgi:hypothetical protein
MNEACGNCRFWRRREDERGKSGLGYCVRFPPFFPAQLGVWPGQSVGPGNVVEPTDSIATDAFPAVHEQRWCGEWKEPRILPGLSEAIREAEGKGDA